MEYVQQVKANFDYVEYRHRWSSLVWLDDGVELLKKMLKAGEDTGAIAKALGVTARQVRTKIYELALEPRKASGWNADREELLKKLWYEGLSCSLIAARLGGGVTRNAVIGKVHRLGLSGRVTISRTKSPRKRRSEGLRRARPHELRLASEGIAPASPRIAAEPLPPEPPRPDKLVSFADLTDKTCRFIYGDPKSNDWGFCTHQKAPGSSYCAGHMGKCSAALEPSKRLAAKRKSYPFKVRMAGRLAEIST